MNSNNNHDNYLPSSEQKLLLRSAILQGEEAISSWERWRASVDIEALDLESYRLLPLLYRNLSAHGVTDLHMSRLKGVYRRTWCENQVLFQKIIAILHCFEDADIKTLLLKDAALNIHYYQDSGSRMIHNFDILVHPTAALKAMSILQQNDWKPIGKIPNKIVPFTHIVGFKNESRQLLNLRWHLFGDGFQETAENDFWNSAILTKVGDLSTYILSPTEQLLYVCSYGGVRNSVLPISRLADAALIINSHQSEIDWNKLLTQAQKCHLVLSLKNILTNLHEILNAPIPPLILREIQDLPISRFERSEYQFATTKNMTVLARLLMRYIQYSRAIRTTDFKFKLLGFPKYLQHIWGLGHLWEVPWQVTIRGIKRLIFARTS